MYSYDYCISFGALYKALQLCQRNTIWKDSVAGYSLNGLKNTYLLEESLKNGKYRISAYDAFKITEPKERDIIATRIKDRQFQRSYCDNVLYPAVTKSFVRDNAACQKNRGTYDAILRLQIHMRNFFRECGEDGFVLQCDVHHFFPSTKHRVAKEAINRPFKDKISSKPAEDIIDSF
ncbi:MAG: hypothetical protein Q4A15_07840, partial [Prevotellaceae bacterium]|nr:hypothetical protein [Prevotellaceae bacterium]